MKKYIVVMLLIATVGCSAPGPKEDALTIYDLVDNVVYDEISYYVVTVEQLSKVRNTKAITYMGTQDDYHLFKFWFKSISYPGEIFYFAINVDSCAVNDESTPAGEIDYVTNIFRRWRVVDLNEGQCTVPKRKVP